MRLIDLLRLVAPVVGVVAIVFRTAGLRMIRAFHSAGATSPERAITPPTGRIFGTFWLERLSGAGVVRPAEGGRYWLDPVALREFTAARRKRALMLLAALVAAVAVIRVVG